MPIALVVPVGIYVQRVLKGILDKITLGISKIYLLVQSGEDEWARKTHENLRKILNMLGPLKSVTKPVEVKDFTDYTACFEILYNLVNHLHSDKDVSEIFVDITSSTRIWTVAATSVASLFKNVKIYYVTKGEPPEKLSIEQRYPEWAINDEGREIIEIVPPFSNIEEVLEDEIAKKILMLLYHHPNNQFISLRDLALKLGIAKGRERVKRSDKLKLRRKLYKLRNKGLIYIQQYTGRALIINLTLFGRTLAQVLIKNHNEGGEDDDKLSSNAS
ncbi:MAG: HFX_2341 family transcriptional regulator domain-containing protein [Candidatus Asgardarchaeia archaeon]